MVRPLFVVALFALLAVGCPSRRPESDCATLETIDLSGCDLASLAQLEKDGVWNTQITLEDGSKFPGYFSLRSGNRNLNGAVITDSELDDDSFYLLAHFEAAQNGGLREIRRAYVACQATDARHFTGKAITCLDDEVYSTGTLKAARLGWPPGEVEASGIELVSERATAAGTTPADLWVHLPSAPGSNTPAYAYVNRIGRTGALSVFNVSDRANPTLIRNITETPSFNAGSEWWNAVWARGNTLYIAGLRQGLLIYDISDPTNPTKVGTALSTPVEVHTLFIDPSSPNILYAISPSPAGEVLLFDIGTSARQPPLVGRFSATGNSPSTNAWPHDAFVFQRDSGSPRLLYVNWWNLGYVIADVTNPTSPVQVGRFGYSGATSHASAVGVIGGRVIAFEGGEDWNAHLRVLDVTDPANPQQIGSLQLREEISIHNMLLVGTKLYVAWYGEGLRVLDVSVPSTPREIAYYNSWRETDPFRGTSFYDGALGIRVPGDGYIYVAESSRGLMIFREQ